MFALAPRFWVERRWRGWAVYSTVTGMLVLLCWEMFIQRAKGNVAGLTPLAGLVERSSAVSHALWIVVLTAAVLVHRMRQRASSA